jgi:hypothetical protein
MYSYIGLGRFIFSISSPSCFYLFYFSLRFFYLFSFSLRFFLSLLWLWLSRAKPFDTVQVGAASSIRFSSGLLLISSLIPFPLFRFVAISYLFYHNFLKKMEHYIYISRQRNLSTLYLAQNLWARDNTRHYILGARKSLSNTCSIKLRDKDI